MKECHERSCNHADTIQDTDIDVTTCCKDIVTIPHHPAGIPLVLSENTIAGLVALNDYEKGSRIITAYLFLDNISRTAPKKGNSTIDGVWLSEGTV